MRLFLRVLCFLILAIGFIIGVIYPFAAGNQQGRELARWQALDENGGFREFETVLPTTENQILVGVEVATEAGEQDYGAAAVLTLTATSGQKSEFAQVFTLGGVAPRAQAQPSSARHFLLQAPTLHAIREEPYRFVFTSGEVALPFTSVELILVGGTYEYDASVPPVGYGMIAIGMLGMILTRRRKSARTPKQPAPRRWGRG